MKKAQQDQPSVPQLTFSFQKITKFLNTLQREISQIRLLGKKISQNNETSGEDILKIMQQRNQIIQQHTDDDKERQRYFKKELGNIQFLALEKTHYQANDIWIRNNLDAWVQANLKPIQALMEKAKKLQSKRLNKILKPEQISQYKAQLLQSTTQHRKSLQQIIHSLSQWQIRNNCALIETLTTTMQQIKISEKKRQSRKAEKNSNLKKKDQ